LAPPRAIAVGQLPQTAARGIIVASYPRIWVLLPYSGARRGWLRSRVVRLALAGGCMAVSTCRITPSWWT